MSILRELQLLIIIFLYNNVVLSNIQISPENLRNSELNIVHFIQNFINEKVPPSCNLILIHEYRIGKIFDQFLNSEDIGSRSHIVGNFLTPNYEVDSSLNLHRFLVNIQCSLNLIDLSTLEVEPENIETTTTTSSTNYTHIHKGNHTQILEQVLIKNFQPVTRKDEDFFIIFLGESISHGVIQTFLKKDFVIKIKFKIIFSPNEAFGGDFITGYAGHFFTWPYENPLILHKFPLYDSTVDFPRIFPDFVTNFYQRQIRVSSPVRLLLGVAIENSGGNKWRLKRGHHAMLMWEMARIFNFTFIAFPASKGGGTGFALKDGTWAGSTGDVLAKRAEVSLITGQIFPRSKLFGFSTPITYLEFIFTVGGPAPSYSWKAIIWPLSTTVWLVSGIVIVMVGVALYWISVQSKERWTLDVILLYILGSFMEQRFEKATANALRIAQVFWVFVCLILATGYRSKLIELLVFPVTVPPPSNFDELVVDSKYSWGLEGAGIGGSVYDNIKSSTNPVYRKLMQKMTLEPDPVPCFLKGLKSKFACLVYRSQTEFIFYKNFSTRSRRNWFYSAKEATFSPHAVGWAQEMRSVFRINFDTIIRRVMSTGIIGKWTTMDLEKVRADRLKWESDFDVPPIFEEIDNEGPKPLSNNHLTGAYYLYVAGLCISICIVLSEIIIPKNFFGFLFKLFSLDKCTHQKETSGKSRKRSSKSVIIVNSDPLGFYSESNF